MQFQIFHSLVFCATSFVTFVSSDRLYLVDLVSKKDRARRLKARQSSSAQGTSNRNLATASSLQWPRLFLYLSFPRMIVQNDINCAL